MRQTSNPTVPNAVVLVLMSAMTLGLGIGSALAEDCAAGPKGASPPGQHWYYRVDRATHRHCWYLHGMMGSAHQTRHASVLVNERVEHRAPAARLAAAEPPAAAAAPWPAAVAPIHDVATPLPPADPPIAEAAPAPDKTPVAPDVSVLAVKTIAVRPPEASAETRSRHRVREAPVSEDAARAYTAAPETSSGPTIFFFLVFGLGFLTFLAAIVLKRVAPRVGWLWPMRNQPEPALRQERRDYVSTRPAGPRPVIGSRGIDRRMVKTRFYADEIARAEYERA
jgi:hypothetical protein